MSEPWPESAPRDLDPVARAQSRVVAGRACGTCTLCCKVIAVAEFDKLPGVWCPHCVQGKGCGVYETRPTDCRTFFCEWMHTTSLSAEWKPERAKFALVVGEGGHLTAFILDHPKVTAGVSISGVFDLAALRDSPHVNDKVKLTEKEIETLSPMRRPGVNKPLAIAYGTGELPAMIASSRDYHAYRSQAHLPGDLVPVANTNHYTILDQLRLPDSVLTRAVLQMVEYKTS